MDQGGETDCDDEDDKPDENIQPLNPDILPRGILLAPAEMGRNVTRTPQIIGMRGANEDDEDSESLVEDSKEENQALLEGNTVITSEVSTRRQLATRKRTRKSLSVPARGENCSKKIRAGHSPSGRGGQSRNHVPALSCSGTIKKKKWWFGFVPWAINLAAVNAWRLRNVALEANGIPFNRHEHNYLDFVREIVEGLMKTHGQHSQTLPIQMSVSRPNSKKLLMFRKPLNHLRYDNVGHCIKKHDKGTRGRCKKCSEDQCKEDKRSTYFCPKCNVSLHVDCFWDFHNA